MILLLLNKCRYKYLFIFLFYTVVSQGAFGQKSPCAVELSKDGSLLNDSIEFEHTIFRYLNENQVEVRADVVIAVVIHIRLVVT